MPSHTELVLEVYRLFVKYDLGTDDLIMTFGPTFTDPEPKVWLDCSDVFDWGTADNEEIATWEDYKLVSKCLDDILKVYKHPIGWDVAMLYASRKRGITPMIRRLERVDPLLLGLYTMTRIK